MSGPVRVIQLDSRPPPQTRSGAGAARRKPKLNREGALQATRQRKAKQPTPPTAPTHTGLDAVLSIAPHPVSTPASTTTASATELRRHAQLNRFQMALQSRRKDPVLATPSSTQAPIRRCVTRRRYRLGREWQQSSNGAPQLVIHAYLSSASQQQRAQQQWATWYQTPLAEIYAFLVQRNLVPYGSHPPEHMVRTLFLSVKMLGDVYNQNIQVKWHNYIHT